MILEIDHPGAIGQFRNLHDLRGIVDLQLPQDIGRQPPQLESLEPDHATSFSRQFIHQQALL